MNPVRFSLGVDPGWKTLGIALLMKDSEGLVSVLKSEVLNPSSLVNLEGGSRWALRKFLEDWVEGIDFYYGGIERFVAYEGTDAPDSENILMTIGCVGTFMWESMDAEPYLYKAFDWKKSLCQYLVMNKGFTNPSTRFDKKYSIAAAKACLDTPYEFKTDHEADAIGIAYTNFLQSS